MLEQTDKTKTRERENQPDLKPLSETISNAHSSGDGAIRLSEDGLIEPTGETIADAEAHKESQNKRDEY